MPAIKHEYLGKVLIVDDKFDEEIKKLINNLAEKGVNTQYWNSKGEFHSSISNVRVLILDLELTGGVVRRGDKFFFSPAAQVLGQIKGPYIVILYARDFVNSDIEGIKESYELINGTPFEGYIEGIAGLAKGKGEDELTKLIFQIIDQKEIYKLIISWEKLLDKSKDLGLRKFVREKFENEVREFVKSIGKDVDNESLPREFVSNMMRFVMRYMHRGDEYKTLEGLLNKIYSDGSSTTISDLLLHNRNMYFTPDKSEKNWTGDIFRIKDSKDFYEYGIILTPECDIAQKKVENYLVCKGFALDFERLKKEKHPIYSIIKGFEIPERGDMKKEQHEEKIKKQLNRLDSDYHRYYTLWNFSETEGKYFGLCFDFQNIQSVNKEEFITKFGDARISRLDFPYVTELMQKFANFSTRLGVPAINHPHIQTD